MNVILIKSKDIKTLNHGSVIVKNLIDSDKIPNLSITEIERVGEKKTGIDTESDTAYYVLEGKGTFTVNGEAFEMEKGDVIFIPKGNEYTHSFGMKLLCVANPRYDREKRKRL